MKLNRAQFLPLKIEDFVCEYYITPATRREFRELMLLPPNLRPGGLRIKLQATKKQGGSDAK